MRCCIKRAASFPISSAPPTHDIGTAFRKHLDAHGHGFQASVLKKCQGLETHASVGFKLWQVSAIECPVTLNGREYHIDGVLELKSDLQPKRFIAVECKRVDPALAIWAFAQWNPDLYPAIADRYLLDENKRVHARACYIRTDHTQTMQLGVDLKRQTTGNGVGRSIDDAVTQSLRGAGGLVERLREWLQTPSYAVTIPMVVTTAELHVTETPLSDADLSTGNMPALTTKKVGWLWFVMNLNQSLLPSVDRTDPAMAEIDVERTIQRVNSRAVMIAHVDHLQDALLAIAHQTSHMDEVS